MLSEDFCFLPRNSGSGALAAATMTRSGGVSSATTPLSGHSRSLRGVSPFLIRLRHALPYVSQPPGHGPLKVCGAVIAYAPQRQHQIIPLAWPMECEECSCLEKLPNLELITMVFLPFDIDKANWVLLGSGFGARFEEVPPWNWGSFVLHRILYLMGWLSIWESPC